MKDTRPVNLNLLKFHFPLPALVSIGHRISGVILFLGLPIAIYLLSQSLESGVHFSRIANFFSFFVVKLITWAFCCALAYHFFAGIKHLLMDIGFAEELKSQNIASIIMLLFFIIFSAFLGVWLW